MIKNSTYPKSDFKELNEDKLEKYSTTMSRSKAVSDFEPDYCDFEELNDIVENGLGVCTWYR